MKIESNRPVGAAGLRKDAKRTSGAGFADNLRTEEAEAKAPVSGTTALSGIDALFALQEVPDSTAERSRGLMRADQMLDRLEDLKIGLLLGSVGRDKLADLARLAREGSDRVSDPKLREVLQDIELRAQVELAKLAQRDD
jgi:hypothetical protein